MKRKESDIEDWRFDCVLPDLLGLCRQYEFLREAVLFGSPKPVICEPKFQDQGMGQENYDPDALPLQFAGDFKGVSTPAQENSNSKAYPE